MCGTGNKTTKINELMQMKWRYETRILQMADEYHKGNSRNQKQLSMQFVTGNIFSNSTKCVISTGRFDPIDE